MSTRVRTIFFLVLSITLGVLAFGDLPTADAVLIDALFVVAALGFIASTVSELFARIQVLSGESRRSPQHNGGPADDR